MNERRPWPTGETSERGSGLIGMSIAFVVVITFLLFATQTMVSLYATSQLTAAAYDGARLAAGARSGADAADGRVAAMSRANAEAHVRAVAGQDVQLDWAGSDADVVRLTITAPKPRLLVAGGVGRDEISRTVEVRVERMR